MKRNKSCQRCPLHEDCHTVCLWGTGDPCADLLFVGEAPGKVEDWKGKPFIGEAGILLDTVLFKLGLDHDDIYITNCFKCHPPDNKLPGIKDQREWFDCCWPYLEQEIQDVNPRVVVLLGGTPLRLMVGESKITKFECMEIETVYEGARTFASFHPAYVLRSPSKEVRLAQAIARGAKAAGMKIKTIGIEAPRYEYETRM